MPSNRLSESVSSVVAVCYPLHYDDAVFVEDLDCPFILAAMLGDR